MRELDECVTVVSGLPRSGTSLMMRMLEAGGLPPLTDGVREPDADNPGGYYELEPVKRLPHDAAWLEGARGRAVKAVHVLLYHLPAEYRYNVVLMQRRLEEVVASQAVMLQRLGRKGADLDGDELVAAFREQLRQLDAWLAKQPNMRVLRVDYNVLVSDATNVVAALRSFLDPRLDGDAMVGVIDRSLYRQRR